MAITSELVSYRSDWPDLFQAEKAAIKSILCTLVEGIYHVGSTAIPGISRAKPEIDIAMLVENFDDIETINSGMRGLGYNVRGGQSEGHSYFSKILGEIRTHKAHLHVRNHPHASEQIVFRDYMGDHPDLAEEYSTLKDRLASENTSGMREYLDGKDDFIKSVLAKAVSEGYVRPIESRE